MRHLAIAIAIAMLFPISARAFQPGRQDWQLVDRAPAAAGASPVRLLSTSSTNTYISADGSRKSVVLEIHCSGVLSTSATISADDDFAVKNDSTVTLLIYLDESPVMHAGWANLSLHRILIYNLRDLLPSHKRLKIELPLGTGSLQSLSFDLSDLASVMRDHGCRRRL